MSSVLVVLYTYLVVVTVYINAQCVQVTVSNSEFNPNIDGTYYLSTYYLCDESFVWQQTDTGSGQNFYIYYVSSYWVIGSAFCDIQIGTQKAVSAPGNYYYPYNAPQWKEFNGSYYVATALRVTCGNGLTPGAIAGIVIGSVFGAILLVTLISMFCVKFGNKKGNRTVARHVDARTTVVYDNTANNRAAIYDNSVEINTIRVQASPPPPYTPSSYNFYPATTSTVIVTSPSEPPPLYVQ